jgi:hypothetical protein
VGDYPLFVALTPDEDHYVHDLEEDIDEVHHAGPRGGIPTAVRNAVRSTGDLVYRFDGAYDEEALTQICQEGADIWEEELRRRRGPEKLPRRLSKKTSAAVALGEEPRPVLPLAPGRGSTATHAVDEAGMVWVLAEPVGSLSIGTDVSDLAPAPGARRGDSGVVVVDGAAVRAWRLGRPGGRKSFGRPWGSTSLEHRGRRRVRWATPGRFPSSETNLARGVDRSEKRFAPTASRVSLIGASQGFVRSCGAIGSCARTAPGRACATRAGKS